MMSTSRTAMEKESKKLQPLTDCDFKMDKHRSNHQHQINIDPLNKNATILIDIAGEVERSRDIRCYIVDVPI